MNDIPSGRAGFITLGADGPKGPVADLPPTGISQVAAPRSDYLGDASYAAEPLDRMTPSHVVRLLRPLNPLDRSGLPAGPSPEVRWQLDFAAGLQALEQLQGLIPALMQAVREGEGVNRGHVADLIGWMEFRYQNYLTFMAQEIDRVHAEQESHRPTKPVAFSDGTFEVPDLDWVSDAEQALRAHHSELQQGIVHLKQMRQEFLADEVCSTEPLALALQGLSSMAGQVLIKEQQHLRQLLLFKADQVEKITSERYPVAPVMEAIQALDPIISFTGTAVAERVQAYRRYAKRLDDLALARNIDARLQAFNEMGRTVGVHERVTNALIDLTIFADVYEVDDRKLFTEMAARYAEAQRRYDAGDTAAARRIFLDNEANPLLPELAKIHEHAALFERFAVNIPLVIASVWCGVTVAALLTTGATRTLLGATLFASAFVATHEGLTYLVKGEPAIYRPEDTLETNALHYAEEVIVMMALAGTLKGAQMTYQSLFPGLAARATTNLPALFEQGSLRGLSTPLRARILDAMGWGLHRVGEFGFEYGGLTAHEAVVRLWHQAKDFSFNAEQWTQDIFSSDSLWQRLLGLVAIKIGFGLASPMTQGLQGAVGRFVRRRLEARLDLIRTRIWNLFDEIAQTNRTNLGRLKLLGKQLRAAFAEIGEVLKGSPDVVSPTELQHHAQRMHWLEQLLTRLNQLMAPMPQLSAGGMDLVPAMATIFPVRPLMSVPSGSDEQGSSLGRTMPAAVPTIPYPEINQIPTLRPASDDDRLTLGSDPANLVPLARDPLLAPVHALLQKDWNSWSIRPATDQAVWVWDRECGEFRRVVRPWHLVNGDVIKLGNTVLGFENPLEGRADGAPFYMGESVIDYALPVPVATVRTHWQRYDRAFQRLSAEERLQVLDEVKLVNADMTQPLPTRFVMFWGGAGVAPVLARALAALNEGGGASRTTPELRDLLKEAQLRWDTLYSQANREIYQKELAGRDRFAALDIDPLREVVTFYHVGNNPTTGMFSAHLTEGLNFGFDFAYVGPQAVWAIDVPMADLAEVMGEGGDLADWRSYEIYANLNIWLEAYGLRRIGVIRDRQMIFSDGIDGDVTLYGNLVQLGQGYRDAAQYARDHGELPPELKRRVVIPEGTVWDFSRDIEIDRGSRPMRERLPYDRFEAFYRGQGSVTNPASLEIPSDTIAAKLAGPSYYEVTKGRTALYVTLHRFVPLAQLIHEILEQHPSLPQNSLVLRCQLIGESPITPELKSELQAMAKSRTITITVLYVDQGRDQEQAFYPHEIVPREPDQVAASDTNEGFARIRDEIAVAVRNTRVMKRLKTTLPNDRLFDIPRQGHAFEVAVQRLGQFFDQMSAEQEYFLFATQPSEISRLMQILLVLAHRAQGAIGRMNQLIDRVKNLHESLQGKYSGTLSRLFELMIGRMDLEYQAPKDVVAARYEAMALQDLASLAAVREVRMIPEMASRTPDIVVAIKKPGWFESVTHFVEVGSTQYNPKIGHKDLFGVLTDAQNQISAHRSRGPGYRRGDRIYVGIVFPDPAQATPALRQTYEAWIKEWMDRNGHRTVDRIHLDFIYQNGGGELRIIPDSAHPSRTPPPELLTEGPTLAEPMTDGVSVDGPTVRLERDELVTQEIIISNGDTE